jgi:hypothetical protein
MFDSSPPSVLVCGVRQQRDVACALDGLGQHALMRRAGSRNTSRQNLAAFGNVALQEFDILEVNQINFVEAEATDLATMHAATAATSTTAATIAAAPARIIIVIAVTKSTIISISVIARHNSPQK